MDFLTTVYTNFSSSLSWIMPFLIVLTILVFFHELGHYLAARYNGVRVEVFSIGFGPELFGWTDSKKTRWKFSLIPLGGYVKMFGDADASSAADHEAFEKMTDEERKSTLNGKRVPQKMAVVAAGPIANILITILCLWAVYAAIGQPNEQALIGAVTVDSPAWKSGLRPGAKVLTLEGEEVQSFNHLQRLVVKRPNEILKISYLQEGEVYHQHIKPEDSSGYGMIGVSPERISHGFFSAAKASVVATVRLSGRMLCTFWHFITGKESAKQIGGLPSIAKMSHDAWTTGFYTLLTFMAILSLNLGIINLLPIPVLDGGHMLFYGLEGIRGKPISEKVQDIGYKIGLWFLIFLMVYSHWNDVVRFKFLERIQSFFSGLF